MLHTTYKLFVASLLLETISLLSDCIAYGNYSRNGVGLPLVKLLGQMSRAASTLVFLLMLVLMAKGYTITRGRLSRNGYWKLTFFMTIFTLIYMTLFIYEARVREKYKANTALMGPSLAAYPNLTWSQKN